MTFIREIADHQAQGELKSLYDALAKARGGTVPAPFRSLSLRPSLLKQVAGMSGEMNRADNALGKRRTEMIATYVSGLNRSPV